MLQDDNNRFGVTLTASLLLHLVLILGLKFSAPELKKLKDHMPSLDVVLVNAKTEAPPEKADTLAQANLDRGGNTEEDRRMKSPLPVPKDKKPKHTTKRVIEQQQAAANAARFQDEVQQAEQHVADLEKQARDLMTQLKAKQAVENEPKQAAPVQPEPAPAKSANTGETPARSLDTARIEAQIYKDWDSYQKRPRRKFVGARVREYRFATYVEAWRQKVEKIGTLNYPEEAKAQKIYGQLRMTVSIRADGTVESIDINMSSGHRVLDEAARRIVELGAPYAAFPQDIRNDTDILSITRTWTFTHEETVSGEN